VILLSRQEGSHLHCYSQRFRAEIDYYSFQRAAWPSDYQLAELRQVNFDFVFRQLIELVAEIVVHSSGFILVDVSKEQVGLSRL